MENKNARSPAQRADFVKLLSLAKRNDAASIFALLEFFKENTMALGWHMHKDRDDITQNVILELIKLSMKAS